jgi:hypothetical protein
MLAYVMSFLLLALVAAGPAPWKLDAKDKQFREQLCLMACGACFDASVRRRFLFPFHLSMRPSLRSVVTQLKSHALYSFLYATLLLRLCCSTIRHLCR